MPFRKAIPKEKAEKGYFEILEAHNKKMEKKRRMRMAKAVKEMKERKKKGIAITIAKLTAPPSQLIWG